MSNKGSINPNKLLLNWKSPESRENYVVGVLRRYPGKYTFQYLIKHLNEAKRKGFTPLVGFSDEKRIYESKFLFPIFERRLPGSNTSTFREILEKSTTILDQDDPAWAFFIVAGGSLATDTLSFVVPAIHNSEDNSIILKFEIAGINFLPDADKLQHLERVNFMLEPDNVFDKQAIRLETDSKYKIGYVPRPLNQFIYYLIDNRKKISGVAGVFKSNRPIIVSKVRDVSSEAIKGQENLVDLIDFQ